MLFSHLTAETLIIKMTHGFHKLVCFFAQKIFIGSLLILQMFEIVSLADDLLPHMPARIINLPTYYHAYKSSSTKKSASIKQDGAGSSSTENERSGREKLLREHPELLQQFGMDLLPTMTQVSAEILLLVNKFKLL